MIPQGSVNIEAHVSIQTPVLTSLHHRSAMEEGNKDFVGSLLRDSLEASSPPNSSNLDDSQAPLDVMPLKSRMGPPVVVPPSLNPKAFHPEPYKRNLLKSRHPWRV
ncbi:hypothetical protein LIER_19119 [Lithospermum erythrorhizon]|uniref:Uncharacterized protein n=1 Tax=Lithospermum erythrorhizon TaxID=34254 RepID=A0AAV3QHJ1_LITER